jgi:hypothetical protein
MLGGNHFQWAQQPPPAISVPLQAQGGCPANNHHSADNNNYSPEVTPGGIAFWNNDTVAFTSGESSSAAGVGVGVAR